MKKCFLLLLSLTLLHAPAGARLIHLLPMPQQVRATGGQPFRLHRDVCISGPLNRQAVETFLRTEGANVKSRAKTKVEIIKRDQFPSIRLQKEAYRLTVTTNHILIEATDSLGVLRAVQTLTQMAEATGQRPNLETVEIFDWPAFAVRGYMLDIGRSFLSFDELMKEVALLSRFKINAFHIHLTENQGWRLESKVYPQLNAPSSYSRFPGMYYTQAQMRQLDKWCHQHGMTLIPEIDMPGHSAAFQNAMGYPMQSDSGITALKALLREAIPLFPHSPYFHMGGDETKITYPGFPQTILQYIHSLGKKVITWNRASFPLAGSGVDMTQMWASFSQAIPGIPNIDCRYAYANVMDGFADVVNTYLSNIYYSPTGNDSIAGSILAIWTDRKLSTEMDIIRQNNFYAYVLARGERAWRGGGKCYVEQGCTMLPPEGNVYFKQFADWERRFLFHKDHSLRNEPIPYVKQTQVHWRITEAFPNEGDSTRVFPPETEGTKHSYIYIGKTYSTGEATGAGIYLRHTWGTQVPCFFAHPEPNTTAYAYTYIYSPKEQTAGAFIEFQSYGRSEADKAPERGCWDRRGTRLWINDALIAPPLWDNTGRQITHEVPLMNENFTARPPYPIHLRKGWNKVLMRLPFLSDYNGVRLQQWMFTFVLVTPDGRHALPDIVYSPDKRL